ncbi:MAG: PorV/PorQ family protein [Candidatus Marinimicrobia bacterium]|nr:PorV/PorQ family protein [Candidatus Neomarinimicrobiota bacterium]
MNKINVAISGILLILSTANAEIQNTGMAFLKIPSSAQSAATMTVFSQAGQSPLAIFENPVGIRSEQIALALSHHFWVADVSIDAMALSIPLKNSSLGFGLNYVRIPGVEVRDYPTDEPAANIEPQYMAIAAGYCWSPIKKIDVGGTIKYLYEHLYTHTGKGIAFDLAGRWRAPSMLDVTFSLQNMGFLDVANDNNRLPVTLTIGIVRPELFVGDSFNSSIGLNFGSNLITGAAKAQVGAEICYRDLLTLRSGFEHIGSINRGALGFGIRINRLGVDYAFIFMPEGFNHPHIITLSYYPG